MVDFLAEDIWPAESGIKRLQTFEESRQLTLRATQKALREVAQKYFRGGEKIVEIGSGLGFMARNMPANYFNSWIQLEGQEAFIEKAREAHAFGEYIRGSAYDLPFADNSLHTITGYCSFDVLTDLETAVSEVYRTLAKGGRFVHLLDLGVNDEVILRDLRKKRIPCCLRGTSTSCWSILEGGTPMQLYYIPEEKLAGFLQEIGMTREEMDRLPEIQEFFGLEHFERKYFEKQKRGGELNGERTFEEIYEIAEDSVEVTMKYLALFKKYEQVLDTNSYFHERLEQTLAEYFPAQNVRFTTVRGVYTGERTPQQLAHCPEAYIFERRAGKVEMGQYFYHQWPRYVLSQKMKESFPRIAQWLEPTCAEIVTLECMVAEK